MAGVLSLALMYSPGRRVNVASKAIDYCIKSALESDHTCSSVSALQILARPPRIPERNGIPGNKQC